MPGRQLANIIDQLGISQAEFARTVGVSPMRISHLVAGKRPVTVELALRISKALGTTPEFWLNLRAAHELREARKRFDLKDIRRIAKR